MIFYRTLLDPHLQACSLADCLKAFTMTAWPLTVNAPPDRRLSGGAGYDRLF